ncbi:MAG: hypothetical protein CL935_04650 [Deltaproteobacteria bacterium]|nr:hypothetical protein [Deltaproteobacteria bacterium]
MGIYLLRSIKVFFLKITIIFFCSVSPAFSIEIGVVDLNKALNQSEPGIRSKNILERRGRQKQQEFKLEESELRKLADELRNNPLLAPKAKEDKQQELITRQQNLREKVREFEQEMRLEERRLSEAIFKELKTVIRSISINEKLDLVLEKNAAQVILYMKQDTTELTQKVIDEYNALKNSGNE